MDGASWPKDAVEAILAEKPDWSEFGRSVEGNEAAGAQLPHPFGDFLRSFLRSEHLVVLAGLGTSRCLTDASGQKVCPSMADLWGKAKAKSNGKFDAIKVRVKYPDEAGQDIEELLSRCQTYCGLHDDNEVADFAKVAEEVIVASCRFPSPGSHCEIHETFLRRVARGPASKARVRIFTTNYDLAFEVAANNARFLVIDGFTYGQPQEFDGAHFTYDFVRRDERGEAPDYLPNVVHLCKLHGSVDWEDAGDGRVVRRSGVERPLIIYPRNTKFENSYSMPFVELMSRFQTCLRQQNIALLVIGSGLRDGHLRGPLEAAIRANVGLRVLVVDPEVKATPHPVAAEMMRLLKLGDRRLALCTASFEQFVPLLPDLVADSERERHDDRMKRSSR